MKVRVPKPVVRLLGLAVGLGAFFLAVYAIPLRQLAGALRQNLNLKLVAVLGLWVLSILFQAWRWQIMLWPQKRVPFHPALKLFIMNRLTNLLLPFRAGEGVRLVAAKRLWNLNVPYVLGTIFNERILNIVFLAVMALILSFYIPDLQRFRLVLYFNMAAILAGIAGLLWKNRGTFQVELVDEEAERARFQGRSPFYKFGYRFWQGLAVFKSPPVLIGTLLTSLASWLCVWSALMLLAQNVQAREPGAAGLALILYTHVASLAHLTPSNVGPFQWGCIFAYSHFGVPQAAAVASSLVFQAVRIVAAALVGLYVLAQSVAAKAGRPGPAALEAQLEQAETS